MPKLGKMQFFTKKFEEVKLAENMGFSAKNLLQGFLSKEKSSKSPIEAAKTDLGTPRVSPLKNQLELDFAPNCENFNEAQGSLWDPMEGEGGPEPIPPPFPKVEGPECLKRTEFPQKMASPQGDSKPKRRSYSPKNASFGVGPGRLNSNSPRYISPRNASRGRVVVCSFEPNSEVGKPPTLENFSPNGFEDF